MVVAHVVNSIEDRDVDERMNKHPEFLEETMFAEHGTKVLITNPASDMYLEQAKRKKENDRIREKYEQWVEPDGDPSY